MATCPACLGDAIAAAEATPFVRVRRCSRCGHRVARFSGPSPSEEDFHLQASDEAYREALRQTRLRQAGRLLGALRRHAGPLNGVLDFGCGRGWFLEAAKAEGVEGLVGADPSAIAVAAVEALGVPAVHVRDPLRPAEAVARLPLRPSAVVLLDVIEHLPPAQVGEWLSELFAALRPELKLAVIKVPVSSGVLYRAASALSRARVSAPLDQLYQVGRVPPHASYFSVRSMQALLERLQLPILQIVRDPELEPEGLARRALFLRRVPLPVATALGRAAVGMANALGMQDSAAFVCRVEH